MGMVQGFVDSNLAKVPEEDLIKLVRDGGNEVLSWIGEGELGQVSADRRTEVRKSQLPEKRFEKVTE